MSGGEKSQRRHHSSEKERERECCERSWRSCSLSEDREKDDHFCSQSCELDTSIGTQNTLPLRELHLTVFVCLILNPLKPELNPICYLLALLAHHFLHVSRIRVKSLTFRRLMSYIYICKIYIYIYIYIYMEHPFLMFLDHTQRRSTVGRTPLDE